jgi:hypothetical protein
VARVLRPRLLLTLLLCTAGTVPADAEICGDVERSGDVVYLSRCDAIRRYDLASRRWLEPIPLPPAYCTGAIALDGGRLFHFPIFFDRIEELGPDGAILATIQLGSVQAREVGGGFAFTLTSDGKLRSHSLDGGAVLAERPVTAAVDGSRTYYLKVLDGRVFVAGGERLWSVAFDGAGALAEPVELDAEQIHDRPYWQVARYGDGSRVVDAYGQVWDAAAGRHVEDLPAPAAGSAWLPLPDGELLAGHESYYVRYDARGFPVASATLHGSVIVDRGDAYAFQCFDDRAEVEVLPLADFAPIERPPIDPAAPYGMIYAFDVAVAGDEVLTTSLEPWLRRYSLDGALRGAIPLSAPARTFDVAGDGSVVVAYWDGRITRIPPGGEETPLTTVARSEGCEPLAVGDLVVACGVAGLRRYAFDRDGVLRGWRDARGPTRQLTTNASTLAGPSTVLEWRSFTNGEIARYDVAPDGTFEAEQRRTVPASARFLSAAPAQGVALVGQRIFGLAPFAEVGAWRVDMEDAAVFGGWLGGLAARDHWPSTTYRERAIGSEEETTFSLPGAPLRLLPIGSSEALVLSLVDERLHFARIHVGGNDVDGDGVKDYPDAFPMDPTEQSDRDGDGVGDNADLFPDDGRDHRDRDGDGIGDNTDPLPDDASGTIARLHGKPTLEAPALGRSLQYWRQELVLQLGSGGAFGLCGDDWDECLHGTAEPANASGRRLRLELDAESVARFAAYLGRIERDSLAGYDDPEFDVTIGALPHLELKIRRNGKRAELRFRVPHHSRSESLGMAFRARYRLQAAGPLEAASGP